MKEILRLKSAFQEIEDIGVIWVIEEATKLGFFNGNPDWANLGQGEPEVGEMKGAPPRVKHFEIEPGDDRYGPLNGLLPLRKAIAEYYNRLYRKNKSSKYNFENVSIAMGGRLALTHIFTIIGNINLGYKVPEYPAYEDMLNYQSRIKPICISSYRENNYAIPAKDLSEAIRRNNLDAFLLSNPSNPTGHVVKNQELKKYLTIAKQQNCTFIFDEVYSHFIYDEGKPAQAPISSAEYIEDVNTDPVLIVDALTKSFRYPGWRLAWVLGPKIVIENLGRAASGIDGGPSLPIQRAAIQLFETERVNKESKALREVFSKKQNLMLSSLRALGMICSSEANSTFYIWADISHLTPPLNNAEYFFKAALKLKVITVPGYMFNIQHGQIHKQLGFEQFIRFSFGPEEENIKMGLERISVLIKTNHL